MLTSAVVAAKTQRSRKARRTTNHNHDNLTSTGTREVESENEDDTRVLIRSQQSDEDGQQTQPIISVVHSAAIGAQSRQPFAAPLAHPDSKKVLSPNSPRRHIRLVNGLLLTGVLLISAIAGLFPFGSSPISSVARPIYVSAPTHNHAFQHIEAIRVGQRVITGSNDSSTAGNPSTWKLLRLRGEYTWDDGTVDPINVETLQSPDWIAEYGAKIGARVPLPLDLVEMGLPEDLTAVVQSIDACPRIAPGPGRVVLTTVNHLSPNVVELTIRNAEGKAERIRPTINHRFFSQDRGDWTTAGSLRPGERLKGLNSDLTVLEVEQIAGVQTVYNMTVEGDHVYHVSSLLAHNSSKCPNPYGARGAPDHRKDVECPGKKQAEALAQEGEFVLTEQSLQGYPGVNRRPDNQVVGKDGKTRIVIESERRPNGPYHKKRKKQMENLGIEVLERPLPPRKR